MYILFWHLHMRHSCAFVLHYSLLREFMYGDKPPYHNFIVIRNCSALLLHATPNPCPKLFPCCDWCTRLHECSTSEGSDQWEWQKIMQSFLWASLDNFCLKLKRYRFLIYNTYGRINFTFFKCLFLSNWMTCFYSRHPMIFFSHCCPASSPHRGMEMAMFFNNQDSWGRSVHLSNWVYLHYPLPQAY